MLRCRKGDLAIVLEGKWLGRVVEVGEFIGSAMLSQVLHHDLWLISHKGKDRHPAFGYLYCQEDRYLLPIRPRDLKEVEEAEKELTV
ncbi:hypothetical protein [Nitrosovibrio sp. Nv6]|uniref:hypothetical protein n=1 Tax=Nitrosovibrio sp. Nv6 TaxID=1855340 RepID=UPI0008C6E999|nr:hypothetical protein [Nitrosovibrio sp. Nv6]SEO78357.1 hypothetical protein SAMN05216316_1088 [Nitrosovibrio sp. Nv6]